MNIERKRSLFIILCIFTAFVAGCRQQTEELVVKAVQGGRVEHYRPAETARYTTALVPASQVNLVFKSPGLVDSICQVRGADGRMRDIQAGDWVRRGTILARVRPAEYEQNVSKARAGLREAQAKVSQAQAALDEANLSYRRAKNLFESASLIKPIYDQAKARYEAASASLNAAHAGVEAATMTLRQAEICLEDTILRAPINGWVLARTIEKGSLAGNSGPGISLIDTHVVKAVFSVPDTTLKKIKKGQTQEIIIEALSRSVKGVVSALSPQADPTSRVFLVEVTIPNPHDGS